MVNWISTKGKWFVKKDEKNFETGWVKDNNKWYYLSPKDQTIENISYIKGEMVTGWLQEGNLWYYLSPTRTTNFSKGEMVTGWVSIDNRWYYFSPSRQLNYGVLYKTGSMMCDWIHLDNKWYYLMTSSEPQNGLYKGQALSNIKKVINGKEYSFNKDCSMIENTEGVSSVSDKCAEYTGTWEGYYSKAYADPYYGASVKKYWTIGYGTTYEVKPSAFPNGLNSTCTKEQALTWLKEELNSCAKTIYNDLKKKGVKLSQNEFDALADFAYNCGTGALLGSTLYKNICKGIKDRKTLSENFEAWSKANGKTSSGLLRRRKSEIKLFFDGDYTGNR